MIETFFPMGFPLEIASNSDEVLAICADLWGDYPQLSNADACRIRIEMGPGDSVPVGRPILRTKDHLLAITLDAANTSIVDLNDGVAHAWFASGFGSQPSLLRHHFLEPLTYVLLASRHFTLAHASCVARDGRAILLCGDSGAGKTCAAYSCARNGWTFLSGDGIGLLHDEHSTIVAGRPFEIRFRETARRLFPELHAYAAAVSPNGKKDIEVDPRDLVLDTAVNVAMRAEASQIVFLDRVEGTAAPALTPLPWEDAWQQLEASICYGDSAMRRLQSRTLSRFLKLPLHRLSYSDAFAAEETLASLLESRVEV